MKSILLRIGIDTGIVKDGLAPVFRDGTLEYIPIPEGYNSLENN